MKIQQCSSAFAIEVSLLVSILSWLLLICPRRDTSQEGIQAHQQTAVLTGIEAGFTLDLQNTSTVPYWYFPHRKWLVSQGKASRLGSCLWAWEGKLHIYTIPIGKNTANPLSLMLYTQLIIDKIKKIDKIKRFFSLTYKAFRVLIFKVHTMV